ncbi:hypothetical protein BH11MYX4_BH11MYX4_15970 [soil metagenome]
MRTVLALVFLAACSASPSEAGPAPAPTSAPSGSSTAPPPPTDGGAHDAGPHGASDALLQCAKSKGEIGSIADAVARLNALAPNGDGPCFIATLPRPLAVVATNGASSAQPAVGRSAPRLLLMLPKLVITVVPAGEGSKLLELGEWIGTTRTIKAEIGLPVTAPLAADAPFLRVSHGTDRTTCGTCHRQEERHPTIPNAFLSLAFKPEPGTFVTLAELEELHRLCTQADDPGSRCTMIHALFDFGEITEGSFSPVVATFQGP